MAASNDPLPPDTLDACLSSDAVLLGAVGDPRLRQESRGTCGPKPGCFVCGRNLGAFANLRPAVCFPALLEARHCAPEIVKGTDMLIVRELLGGLYFGQPRSIEGETGSRQALNTMRYGEAEIERIARVAFELARGREAQVLSVDKANVLECSRLWREVVTRLGQDYPDVQLTHHYVDSAAMLLVLKPTEFDVILTENMFGDILSDEAGGVVGALGLLASASIGGPVGLVRAGTRIGAGHRGEGHRESAGGHSVGRHAAAAFVPAGGRSGVHRVGRAAALAAGHRTAIWPSRDKRAQHSQMGNKVAEAARELAAMARSA